MCTSSCSNLPSSSGPTCSSGLSTSNRSRPSRIPQPVRHHSPALVSSSAIADSDKLSGMFVYSAPVSPLSFSVNFTPSLADRVLSDSVKSVCYKECFSKIKAFDGYKRSTIGLANDLQKKFCENTEDFQPSLAKKINSATVSCHSQSPLNFPLSFGKESTTTSIPFFKRSFWSSLQVPSCSDSITFPGDTLQHKGLRQSTQIKDSDGLSTCSSTSEQSIHSQSNGVRRALSTSSPNLSCSWGCSLLH